MNKNERVREKTTLDEINNDGQSQSFDTAFLYPVGDEFGIGAFQWDF